MCLCYFRANHPWEHQFADPIWIFVSSALWEDNPDIHDYIFHQIRVAVVPYNDHAFRVIDFDSYGSKDELLTELGKIAQA